MNVEQLRAFCLSLPGATEGVRWEEHLVFFVGGKMFASTNLDGAPGRNKMSIKATPERFAELTERDGIIPAPYLARAKWIALERWDAVSQSELKQLITESYELVKSKLPKRAKTAIG